MSTRCNIVLKDGYGQELIFYRHSDGYPEGVAKTLREFLKLVKQSRIRNNVSQAAGWLILLGAEEYGKSLENLRTEAPDADLSGWKVGAYEPTLRIHFDIEYLYEIDLAKKTLRGWEHDGTKKGKPVSIPREEKRLTAS
jgi:hypothetical protein